MDLGRIVLKFFDAALELFLDIFLEFMGRIDYGRWFLLFVNRCGMKSMFVVGDTIIIFKPLFLKFSECKELLLT